ncbi:TIGR02594 family protein [Cereibacter sphaeroides f. sp. denitrificans]|nr:TIGR02594 family protein [Cereibacter sphaeroides f. sp. denitrificans]
MSEAVKQLQTGLLGLGFSPGLIDGLEGPKTLAAAVAYVASRRGGKEAAPADLPWMIEARSVFGLHETRDKARLSAWLKGGGKYLGDPSALPWCGDFAETCIARALPDEPFPGALGENPFWARNWTLFGKPVKPTYGAILPFSRDGGGHVAFAVGEDTDSFFVLGGNQGNSVSIVRIHKSRLIDGLARWPTTFPHAHKPLPRMSAAGIPKSVNEF